MTPWANMLMTLSYTFTLIGFSPTGSRALFIMNPAKRCFYLHLFGLFCYSGCFSFGFIVCLQQESRVELLHQMKEFLVFFYNATTSTKATQENFLQTWQWESHIGTMDFHKINYVWQIYPLLQLFCCFITSTLLANL